MTLNDVISHIELRVLEDHQVDVTLTDGTHLANCRLVSAGRLWAKSVWLASGDTDLIFPTDEVSEITPAQVCTGRAA